MGWDREKEKQAGKKLTIGTQIFGLVFAIFWCCAAASMGAWFMLLFGIPLAELQAYRLYVIIQMSKKEENPPQDPWDAPAPRPSTKDTCPHCGTRLGAVQNFCPNCGRRL